MIPLFKVHMPESVDAPLLATLHSGMIGQGPKVEEFEARLAVRLKTPYVLTVNNGTAAIQLALRLAGVGPGDEVISTPMTCTASNMPILAQGGSIVWADIDPKTGEIDASDVTKKVSHATKAVVAVSWGGYPCDLDALSTICAEQGIALIQDNAHALGAEYHGRQVHEFSRFSCYSFQAIKHLTTVDGGMLVCRDEADYKRGKLLRWYGIDREDKRQDARIENSIPEFGYKWHMNDVAATIGLEQLKYVDQIIYRHRANAAYYDEQFWRRDLFRSEPLVYKRDRLSSYWLYTILVDDPQGFRQYMADCGVQVSPAHKRNDGHTCFADAKRGPLPGVDEFAKRQMNIPVGWWVTDADRKLIMDAIENWDFMDNPVSER
jgi:dTDP-4-amino-4,6-dideoxygalactose transaminase